MSNASLPPLSALINTDKIPEFIKGLDLNISGILDQIDYKDFIINTSLFGDAKGISLKIVFQEEIGFDILGTGIKLVLNPNFIDGETATEIDVSLSYLWPIIRYFNQASSFSGNPEDIFKLLRDFFNIEDTDLLNALIIRKFSGDLHDFVLEANSRFVLSEPLVAFSGLSANPMVDITLQLIENDVEFLPFLFGMTVNGSNLQEDLCEISYLFETITDNLELDLEQKIKEILTPTINASISNIAVGLVFPENYLKPVDPVIPQ